jgi:hypothetical protein
VREGNAPSLSLLASNSLRDEGAIFSRALGRLRRRFSSARSHPRPGYSIRRMKQLTAVVSIYMLCICFFPSYRSSSRMSAAILSASMPGPYRRSTRPSSSTKNLTKFHSTSAGFSPLP